MLFFVNRILRKTKKPHFTEKNSKCRLTFIVCGGYLLVNVPKTSHEITIVIISKLIENISLFDKL